MSQPSPAADAGIRKFVAIWLAQLFSTVGSSLTGFVLGVWAFQETGSVTQFAIILLCTLLPGIVVAPFAGVVTDRFDRWWVLVLADVGAVLPTAGLLVVVLVGELQVPYIYVATVISATFNLFQGVTYQAITPLLIPKRHLGRANGLFQTAQAATIAAPVVAGVLLQVAGLRGVLLVDIGTFLVALGVLLAVRLPPEVSRPSGPDKPRALRSDLSYGLRYLRDRSGLLRLAVSLAVYNFLFAIAGAVVQPLILTFAGPATLGTLMFAGGGGMFAGALVMSAWGGPRRKVNGVALFMLLGGVALALHSLRPSPWLIAVVAPAFLFTMPIVNGCTSTVFQLKADPAALGRVMATTRMIGQSAMPLGYVAVGPLIDRGLEPLMRPDGALAGSVGAVIGVGSGRGIALSFLLTGAALMLLAAATYLQPRLRRVEDELPDAQPDEPDEPGTGQPGTGQPETDQRTTDSAADVAETHVAETDVAETVASEDAEEGTGTRHALEPGSR